MPDLPKVIASSVIRSSVQGESHGGVYVVDLATDEYEHVIDWNDQSISWEGRGWDRGLRGIAFYNDHIYLAASDEIFIYNQQFEIVGSLTNAYLKHCHEITVYENKLYLTSTGFDSILVVDLETEEFIQGMYLDRTPIAGPRLASYDPMQTNGPLASMECHINNITWHDNKMFISGTKLNTLYCLDGDHLFAYATLPLTTHNARPYQDGVLCNDTASDRVAYLSRSGEVIEVFPVIRYPESELSWTHLTQDRARQAFARGLCFTQGGLIIAGTSPSTISVYQHGANTPLKTVQLTNDIRNSIHGLEVWPY